MCHFPKRAHATLLLLALVVACSESDPEIPIQTPQAQVGWEPALTNSHNRLAVGERYLLGYELEGGDYTTEFVVRPQREESDYLAESVDDRHVAITLLQAGFYEIELKAMTGGVLLCATTIEVEAVGEALFAYEIATERHDEGTVDVACTQPLSWIYENRLYDAEPQYRLSAYRYADENGDHAYKVLYTGSECEYPLRLHDHGTYDISIDVLYDGVTVDSYTITRKAVGARLTDYVTYYESSVYPMVVDFYYTYWHPEGQNSIYELTVNAIDLPVELEIPSPKIEREQYNMFRVFLGCTGYFWLDFTTTDMNEVVDRKRRAVIYSSHPEDSLHPGQFLFTLEEREQTPEGEVLRYRLSPGENKGALEPYFCYAEQLIERTSASGEQTEELSLVPVAIERGDADGCVLAGGVSRAADGAVTTMTYTGNLYFPQSGVYEVSEGDISQFPLEKLALEIEEKSVN